MLRENRDRGMTMRWRGCDAAAKPLAWAGMNAVIDTANAAAIGGPRPAPRILPHAAPRWRRRARA